MTEIEKELQRQTEYEKRKGTQQTMFLIKVGTMAFLTFCACVIFFFFVYRYKGVASVWKTITSALQPIIIGLILAYLLNPVMMFCEKKLLPFVQKHTKTEEKAKGVTRTLSITGAILFFLILLVLFFLMLIPSLVSSITRLVETLPNNVQQFITMMESGKLGDYSVTGTIGDLLTKLTDFVENWVQNTLMPNIQSYILQITSGVISMVTTIVNFIIGIIVVAYVLAIKEQLIGQSKKVVYAILKPRWGNIIVELFHKADEVFGGFIIGNLLDSLVVGIVTWLGCVIMGVPDPVLIAVVIGVTNLIPVFGPFIGAVPTLLLVVIQSPLHALYLLIFLVVMQQIDGNIIAPKILGDSTGLSSFWVMFAILIGGGLFGFAGMLFGVPTFAMIYYIISRLVNHGIKKKHLTTCSEDYVNAASVDAETGQLVYYGEKKKKKRIRKNAAPKADSDDSQEQK